MRIHPLVTAVVTPPAVSLKTPPSPPAHIRKREEKGKGKGGVTKSGKRKIRISPDSFTVTASPE